jgi:hypothetical protein
MTTDARPTHPIPVDPALESRAASLRADLAARGVPAGLIDDVVVLALAHAMEWVAEMQRITNQRLERMEDHIDDMQRQRLGLTPGQRNAMTWEEFERNRLVPTGPSETIPEPIHPMGGPRRENPFRLPRRDPDDIGGHPRLP